MKYTNSEISFYADTLIVEAILGDTVLTKKADSGLINGLIEKVKEYVGNNIDPNDKAGSVMNILAPGVISMAFKAMGLGWLGLLIGLCMRVFHIDVSGILGSIHTDIKSMVSGDKQITSNQVDQVVDNAVQQHTQPATQQEADEAASQLKTQSFNKDLKDAKLLKLAMIEFEQGLFSNNFNKTAGFLDLFRARKVKTASLLARVLGWVFKVALASAGLMVAGDVVNKFLGRPNALDGTVQKGKPVEQGTAPSLPSATQTKFPVNPSYHSETYNVGENSWVEKISNNVPAIEEMLIDFAKEVYSGLDGKEQLIRETPGFQVVRDRISWYNHAALAAPLIYLPRYFTSKKQIVDTFIDDVAQKSA